MQPAFFGRNKSIHDERGWENLSAPFPTITTQVKHAPTLNKGVKKIFIAFWFKTQKRMVSHGQKRISKVRSTRLQSAQIRYRGFLCLNEIMKEGSPRWVNSAVLIACMASQKESE
jgi:hypothetical protein